MASLSIGADRAEVRVTAGIPAAIDFEVIGWPEPGLAVSVASEPAGLADQWISAYVSPWGGTTWRGVVTFDPSRGSRARPGTYPVEVSVHGGDQRASIVVRFVVERHPCLQIRPQPSFTWDPFTNTAKLKVALWNCGNVDLGVNWTARLQGRHLEVDPVTVSVLADSGVTETTLSIRIPDAKVDLETEIDVEARSEVRVDRFPVSQASDLGKRSRPRRRSGRLAAALAAVVIVIAAIAAVVTLTDDPPNTTVAGASPTPVVTSTSGINPSATVVTPSTQPGTAATVPPTTSSTTTSSTVPPADLEVDSAAQAIEIFGGEVDERTFGISNVVGSAAEIRVGPISVDPEAGQPYFVLSGDDCEGLLEPGAQCDVVVSFQPPSAGSETYTGRILLDESTTGQTLELQITGRHYPTDVE